jgi:S1-C subfamily serine protease/Tfp pilus assembly protein PilF
MTLSDLVYAVAQVLSYIPISRIAGRSYRVSLCHVDVRRMSSLLILIVGWTATAAEPDERLWYDRIVPGCVWVRADTEGAGSGWIVDREKKWILTNYHVVGSAQRVTIVFSQRVAGEWFGHRRDIDQPGHSFRSMGTVIRKDPRRDLALIETEAMPESSRSLSLALQSAQPGQNVTLIGQRSDLSELGSAALGTIRQRYRSVSGYPWRADRLARHTDLLLADLPIHEGDSGAPLLNERGEVVGMAAAIMYPAQRSTAAIDVVEIRRFLELARPAGERQSPAASRLYELLLRVSAAVESPTSSNRGLATLIDPVHRLWLTTGQAVGSSELVWLVLPGFSEGRLIAEQWAYFWAIRVRAFVIARDTLRDLVLLEAAQTPTTSVRMPWPTAATRPGYRLHTLANPPGTEARWLYTSLVVRQTGRVAVTRDSRDGAVPGLILQGPGGGDGGAPVLDDHGEFRGIMASRSGPDPFVAYAIDQSEIQAFVRENQAWYQPKSTADFRHRAKVRARWRQFNLARDDMRQALALTSGPAGLYLELARIEMDAGQLTKAREMVEQAVAKAQESELAEVRAWYAEILRRLGDHSAAWRECERALTQDTRCAVAYAVRSALRMSQGDAAAALRDAEEAVWLQPHQARWLYQLGQVHAVRGDWERAILAYSRAIEQNPFDPMYFRERANAWEQKTPPEPDKAERDRRTASRLR